MEEIYCLYVEEKRLRSGDIVGNDKVLKRGQRDGKQWILNGLVKDFRRREKKQ